MKKYLNKLEKDLRVLIDQETETDLYLKRKQSYLLNAESPREISRTKAQIESAKADQHVLEKELNIDRVRYLQLQQNNELLLSVYDPVTYENLRTKRANYRTQTIEKEEKHKQLQKIFIILGAALIGVFCLAAIIMRFSA